MSTVPPCLPWQSFGSNWHRRPSARICPRMISREASPHRELTRPASDSSPVWPLEFRAEVRGSRQKTRATRGALGRRRLAPGTISGRAQFITRRRASPSTPARRWAPVASHLVSAAGASPGTKETCAAEARRLIDGSGAGPESWSCAGSQPRCRRIACHAGRDHREHDIGDQLSRSKGIVCPPAGVDPVIAAPPVGGGRTPVIPPPGMPGGDPTIIPK
jgi:hypothetical protein